MERAAEEEEEEVVVRRASERGMMGSSRGEVVVAEGEGTRMAPEEVAKTALKSVQQTTSRTVTQFGGRDEAERYVKTVYKSVLVSRKLPQAPRDQLLVVTIIQATGITDKWRGTQQGRPWRIFCTLDFQGMRRTTSGVPASANPTFNELATFTLQAPRVTSSLKISLWASAAMPMAAQHRLRTQPQAGGHATYGGDDDSDSGELDRQQQQQQHGGSGGGGGGGGGGFFRRRRDLSMRFLGQILLKPSDLHNMASASGAAPLPLQKRSPRSTVRGTLALGVDIGSRQQLSQDKKKVRTKHQDIAAHDAATKAREGYWPEPPSDLAVASRAYYEACYTILTYEATLMENEEIDLETPRSCSDAACYALEAMAHLPGCSPFEVKLAIQHQLTAAILQGDDEKGIGPLSDYSLLVVWLTYLFKVHFHARGDRSIEGLHCYDMPDECKETLLQSLDRLLLFMQVDLVQYKFQFAAHSQVVPPLFDHFLNAFVTAQAMLAALRPGEESPQERVRRCVYMCKEKIFRLIAASVEAMTLVSPASRLASMAEMVEEELKYDLLYYAHHFRRHADLDCLQLNAEGLCLLHEQYMADELASVLSQEHPTISVMIMDVFRRVRAIKEKYVDLAAWRKGRAIPYAGRHTLFMDAIKAWLLDLSDRVPGIVSRALQVDPFQPINDTTLHSTSVLDLMAILTQTLFELAELRWADVTTGSKLFHLFAEVVVDTLSCYCDSLRDRFGARDARAATSSSSGGGVGSGSGGGDLAGDRPQVSAKLCVAINDLAQFKDCVHELQELTRRHILSITDAQLREEDLNSQARTEPAYDDISNFNLDGDGGDDDEEYDVEASEYACIEDVLPSDEEESDDSDGEMGDSSSTHLRSSAEQAGTADADADADDDDDDEVGFGFGHTASTRSARGKSSRRTSGALRNRNSVSSNSPSKTNTPRAVAARNRSVSNASVSPQGGAYLASVAVDPLSSMRQVYQLALEEISKAFSPMLNVLTNSIFPVVEQYLNFMVGFRRNQPILSKVFSVKHSGGSIKTKFHVEGVEGLDDRKLERVKRKMQRMARRSRRATWRRHQNRPSSDLDRSQEPTAAEHAALLSDAQVRISMEPLLDYLDSSLHILSENLYEDVFTNVLARIWDATVLSADNKVNRSQAHMDIDQSATLYNFLGCLRDYFNADGSGLPQRRLRTRVYERLMEQLRLSRQATDEIMWWYWEEQTRQKLDVRNYERPSVTLQLEKFTEEDGTHKMMVRVRRCNNLPKMTSRGTARAAIDLVLRTGCGDSQQVQERSFPPVQEESLNPVVEQDHVFDVQCFDDGLLRVGVYHAADRKRDYMGEACLLVDGLQENEKVDVTKPLVPLKSKQATILLSVLATRRGEPDAVRFVEERAGEVRGRVASSSRSKLHVVVGHHFVATGYAIPPECSVCQGLIFGVGKKVYLCELCGMTVHKRCHFSAHPCPNSLSQSCA